MLVSFLVLPLLRRRGGRSRVWRFWTQPKEVTYLFLIFQEKVKQNCKQLSWGQSKGLGRSHTTKQWSKQQVPSLGDRGSPQSQTRWRKGTGQDLACAGPPERGRVCSSLRGSLQSSSPRFVRGKLLTLEYSVLFPGLDFSLWTLGILLLAQPALQNGSVRRMIFNLIYS